MVAVPLIDRLKIDDPVGAVAVHGFGGAWGMLAVGLFVDIDPLEDMTAGRRGLFHGGGFYLLGVQTLAVVCIIAWSGLVSFILLYGIDKAMGLRMTEEEEILGADYCEHGIGQATHLDHSSRSAFGFRSGSRVGPTPPSLNGKKSPNVEVNCIDSSQVNLKENMERMISNMDTLSVLSLGK